MAKNKKKTGNFLKEIQKQSEEHRNQLLKEISAAKKEAVSQAEQRYEVEAEKYINRQLSIAQSNIKSEYAVKTLKSQGELFKMRADMTEKVFQSAKEKLISYTEKAEYKSYLLRLAGEIAEKIKNNDCTVFLKAEDMKYYDEIKALFQGNVEFQADSDITIGGLKAYCQALSIVADNTLDSKLMLQQKEFLEKAKLQIV